MCVFRRWLILFGCVTYFEIVLWMMLLGKASAVNQVFFIYLADDCRNIAAILKGLLERGYLFSNTGFLT